MTAQEMLVFELTALLGSGNLPKALPLAERGSRQYPKNAELASFYIIALCQSRKHTQALEFYHERVGSVDKPELLRQAAAMGWMELRLKHLTRSAMSSIADHDPESFAGMEADCRREARARGVSEEQLLFEDQARERYLLGDYDGIEEQAGNWFERYPQSGSLRAVVAASRYQQGRLQEGLNACLFEQVCPGLIFQQVKLLMALGRPGQARRVARPLARYRSRDEQELLAQLQTLLLLNQNKALIRVALRTKLDLKPDHPGALLTRAGYLARHGQIAEARRMWRSVERRKTTVGRPYGRIFP